MIPIAAAISAAILFGMLAALGTIRTSLGAIGEVRSSMSLMSDPALGDAERERAVRSAGLGLLRLVGVILVQVLIAVVAAVGAVYLMAAVGLVDADRVFAFLTRIDVNVVIFAIVTLFIVIGARRARNRPASAYSGLDRALHRIAFAHPAVAETFADVDDRMAAAAIAELPDTPPVFVTSLARAGTTVLLQATAELPGVATHTYRDMPFVMSPILWGRMRKGFNRKGEAQERAHGDGLSIDFDSPEAFEDVIWRHFWPDHYRGDRIPLWTAAEAKPEATAFFRRHFRKIVALRRPEAPTARYLSKNNNNISRLPLLQAMFPEATIVVPFRDPTAHAASLWRQHENFVGQQHDDAFTARYMRDIGHFEFGAGHKPFDFPGFDALRAGRGPETLDYWLAYWIAAFRTILETSGPVYVAHADLVSDPMATMAALCDRLALPSGDLCLATTFRAPTPPSVSLDPALLAEAEALHAALAAARLRP